MNQLKKMQEENGLKAYFTVEAAMVFPIVLTVLVGMIYLLFFQYDRCLFQQDTGIWLVCGSRLPMEKKQETLDMLWQRERQLTEESYLAWERGECSIIWKGSQICVRRCGSLQFPFQKIGSKQISAKWPVDVDMAIHMVDPVSFIRNCRKILEKRS